MENGKTSVAREIYDGMSRRRFLQATALSTGIGLAPVTLARAGKTANPVNRELRELQAVLARCGSEFGDLHRAD